MIRQTAPDDPRLRLVGGHPLIAANIGGRAACPQPRQDFWLVEQVGAVPGFLCRMGETLYATAQPPQSQEIAEFALTVGFGRLMADLVLPLATDCRLVAMQQTGTPPSIGGRGKISFFTQPSPGFSAVAFAALQLHSQVLTTAEETQSFAVNLSHQLRNESAAAVTIELDGQLVAGAALTHRYHGTAVLDAVAVLPQYRGQGLGRAVAAAACQLAAQCNVTPLLCCSHSLAQLYRSVGFVPSPTIYCYAPYRKE